MGSVHFSLYYKNINRYSFKMLLLYSLQLMINLCKMIYCMQCPGSACFLSLCMSYDIYKCADHGNLQDYFDPFSKSRFKIVNLRFGHLAFPRGARYLTGESLKVVWAEFSILS